MSIYKLPGSAIESNTITITQIQTTAVTQIQASASGGPKVTGITYPNNTTAVANTGNDTVVLNGTGFESGVTVIINNNTVPSVTRTNANSLSFTTAALSSTTYPIYVVNPDGGTAIFVNPGLQVSGKPFWITTTPLTAFIKTASLSTTLQANSDSAVTYSLAGGSSLPSGLTLAANGLISGTLSSPPANTTTYNFTVVATDAENQSTSSAFSIDAQSVITATGGTVSNIAGYRVHTFTSNGSFTVTETFGNSVEFLIVGGGGGGGQAHAGGGGGGGVKSSVSGSTSGGGTPAVDQFIVSATTYAVVVGGGGVSSPNRGTNGSTGGSSSVFGVTALGGGGGGSEAKGGNTGGTGGGAATGNTVVAAGTAGHGFAGGISSFNYVGGGGGAYGGYNGGTRALGGSGGGGNGNGGSNDGSAGTAGLGGGGGGGGYPIESGYAGGSGIVIIRYPV